MHRAQNGIGVETMKTKFQVIQEHASSDIENKVQRLLDEGWKIVNVGFASGLFFPWFAALVKETDVEEYTK